MSLSGGERRRAEIARGLATDPDFILLDEPFAGVDPISVNDIKGIIRHLKDRGIGVLITDHNVREPWISATPPISSAPATSLPPAMPTSSSPTSRYGMCTSGPISDFKKSSEKLKV